MNPVLSIVVPVHNVAPYLDECLASIAGQYHHALEVIMVDDGSSDDSPAIAARWAAADSRFTLVSKANAGLGAARNTGTRHATGDHLMFVDSDDVLPPYAAEVLLAALAQTGSDFSCGNVLRLGAGGLTPSPMHRTAFAQTRLRTHVSRLPALLGDRTAWNKVYRRSFWDAHGLAFPEGVLYEDAPVTIPAHVLATAVDVLDVPVYFWRERTGPDRSITQRRGELPAFVDRLDSCATVSALLARQGQEQIKRRYDASVLTSDLMLFVRELPGVDDEYRRVFLQRSNAYLDTVDPRVIGDLPTNLRVLWTLVRHRMLPELLELVPQMRARQRIARHGLRRYHDMALLHARLPQLPAELFLAGTPRPRTRVHEVGWVDGRLRIRGHAFIPGQSAARVWSTSRLIWLDHPDGTRTRRLPLANRRCADATADHGTTRTTYDWSGFEAVIDPQGMRAEDGSWRTGEWSVVVGVVGPSRRSKGSLETGQGANPLRLDSLLCDGVRITPYVTTGRLKLLVEKAQARLTGARADGDELAFEGTATGLSDRVTARLSRTPGVLWKSYPVHRDGDRFTFRVPVADLGRDDVTYPPLRLGEPADRWLVELGDGDGCVPLLLDAVTAPFGLGTRTVHLRATAQGHPVLAALPAGPVLTEVATSGRRYRLGGSLPATGDRFALVLRLADNRETRTFAAAVHGDTWSAEVDPEAVPVFGHPVRLRAGTWNVLCRTGDDPVRPLPVAGFALASLPLPAAVPIPRVTLEWLADERAVLRVRTAIAEDDRGTANALRRRTAYYPERRRHPLRDTVLYNSFTGRQYSDSPRAVHEELVSRGLPLEHRWVSADGQAPVPPTAGEVALWSRDWYDALATSRYVVTNQHLPEWFRRRDGQVVIQTWHGTPLKRIGLDIADVRFADRRYLEKLAVEAPNWTHLVSPNRFSSPILRRAFGYTGELLEIGYPRNDILFRDREQVAAGVRAAVGIPAGRRVVLYAPTWRDDEYSGGNYRISMKIDVEDAAAKLGADHVLLVRRHPNVLDEIPGVGGGFVYDVSTYPDMADLLAVADVLVTDYSSVMFDFANTGRPMLFFTYDLAHYRDELRGFSFDFEAEAPGPLLGTSPEVVAAIRDVDATAARYAERYRAFAAKACDLDDGHAAARLVDAMLTAASR